MFVCACARGVCTRCQMMEALRPSLDEASHGKDLNTKVWNIYIYIYTYVRMYIHTYVWCVCVCVCTPHSDTHTHNMYAYISYTRIQIHRRRRLITLVGARWGRRRRAPTALSMRRKLLFASCCRTLESRVCLCVYVYRV